VGISVAFYPLLFYWTRTLLPSLQLGPSKMWALLAGCAAVAAWNLRRAWPDQCAFSGLEGLALFLFGATLFTRLWILRDFPYPAWTDSLHHTLLTHLTAGGGKLPETMAPYFPVPLGQYHLGLYAISGTVQMLAGLSAHSALLLTAQILNGLSALGVYLFLDRKVGRLGALAGALVVGLLSHQPAWYVNWGRFTQVAGQSLLLVAGFMTWQALRSWRLSWAENRIPILWDIGLASLLNAAVFLLHFRVAAFYAPLLLIIIGWELWKAFQDKQFGRTFLGAAVIIAAALLLVSPALWEALRIYVERRIETPQVPSAAISSLNAYFQFDWETLPDLAASTGLLVAGILGGIIGLARGNKVILGTWIWVGALFLLGGLYLLERPILAFTNMSAVFIMLYLPLGLMIGGGVEEMVRIFSPRKRKEAAWVLVPLFFLLALLFIPLRSKAVEPYRHFITPADLKAMEWINRNLPQKACFAVNTVFWLPNFPHGTDGGYWLPYFTGRETTAGVMLFTLGSSGYRHKTRDLSRMALRAETDPSALEDLRKQGIEYIYLGKKGNYTGRGLDSGQIQGAGRATLLYDQEGVSILRIEPPKAGD
jgi:hypothetical protein